MTRAGRRRLPGWIGLIGAALGVVAGGIQIVAGYRIPEWTGAKVDTLPLGLLTIGLSVVAGLAARRQRRTELSVLARGACALGLIGPALLCLTTVGRLWNVPAVLLLVAGVLTVDSWRATASARARDLSRVLLNLLGGAEMLMAAGSSPLVLLIGGVGGVALVVAAWLRTSRPAVTAGLVVLGTVPFAVLGWPAVVPILLMLLAAGLTALVMPRSSHAS
jgi:hypothetical protein